MNAIGDLQGYKYLGDPHLASCSVEHDGYDTKNALELMLRLGGPINGKRCVICTQYLII